MLRTKLFQQLPWEGGLNLSLDPSMIEPNQLTIADHIVFNYRGSRKKRDSINFDWDSGTNSTNNIIGGCDFWFGTSLPRTQYQVAVSDAKKVYYYNSSGTRTQITLDAGATAWSSAITDVTFLTINNELIIAVDGAGNVPRKWDGSSNLFDLGGTPPQASIVTEFLGRVWCNDKTALDRVFYSTTGNPEEWGGNGDSGALDVGVGDGDPGSITAIFKFRGTLFVAKKTKIYRIDGLDPESFSVQPVTSGIGVVGPNAWCPVDDNNDIMFVSERGFHSLQATLEFGDEEDAYLSKDIQLYFNTKFQRSRLNYIKAAYLSNENSVFFAVTDVQFNTSANNTLWAYNFNQKAWYRWPNISCQSIWLASDSDKRRFYLGTNQERVAKTYYGTNYDVDSTGNNTAILLDIKTGLIYCDEGPYTIKGFKKFALIFNPQGNYTITITFRIDNYPPQSLVFNQIGTGTALLGSTFVLGTSALGYVIVDAPYTQTVDGYGRGFTIEIQQSGVSETLEIQGFAVEYEVAGTQQETI